MDSIQSLKKRLRLPRFLNIKVSASRAGVCCIGITPTSFTLAQSIDRNGDTHLRFLQTYPCTPENFAGVLEEKVKENHLSGMNCIWMLQQEDYLLFTMEELPVPKEEFQAAIRWKIKKLLPYPVEDAVVDRFTVPAPLITDPKRSMTVVVSQASKLLPVSKQINDSGLDLKSIDITELGLRNITSLYESGDASLAFVYLRDKNSNLLISRQKEFYLSRRLDLDVNAFLSAGEATAESHLDKLALQLQRSFDYYHSQWRRPAPESVLLSTPRPLMPGVMKQLSERLNIPIVELDLNTKLHTDVKLTTEQQSNSLAVIGGSIQIEIKANAAN